MFGMMHLDLVFAWCVYICSILTGARNGKLSLGIGPWLWKRGYSSRKAKPRTKILSVLLESTNDNRTKWWRLYLGVCGMIMRSPLCNGL